MNLPRVAALASAAVVTVAIVTGLYLSGTPAQQRQYRIDERRIQDLTRLSSTLEIHWRRTGRLPAELAQLVDGQRLREMPTDPETAAQYSYEILDSNKYQLCADFTAPSEENRGANFWAHEAGRWCYRFELETQP